MLIKDSLCLRESPKKYSLVWKVFNLWWLSLKKYVTYSVGKKLKSTSPTTIIPLKIKTCSEIATLNSEEQWDYKKNYNEKWANST